MYCVIQKIKNKKPKRCGHSKRLEVSATSWSSFGSGEVKTKYTFVRSSEKFERSVLDAYKISIHRSHRKNGKVIKKQWVIATMSYYDLVENSWVGDYIVKRILKEKLNEMGISEECLWDMIYEKLQPIIDNAMEEFKQTEEYKAVQEQQDILDSYYKNKKEFEDKYGLDTYDYCYDIFGVLRNEDYLESIEASYQTQQQYKKNSYYDKTYSNYNYSGYDSNSYYETNQSNYSEEDKEKLKKIYKALAMKFHPDVSKDNGDMMKFINKLKEDWKI